MIFSRENCKKMFAKLKTQSRRVEQPGDVALYDQKIVGGKVVDYIRAVVRNGRLLWEVGRTYAIQPGRGKKSLGRFLLTGIRRERLRKISLKDVMAEGFRSLPQSAQYQNVAIIHYTAAFAEYWDTIHKPGERWEDDKPVWVLTMEVTDG